MKNIISYPDQNNIRTCDKFDIDGFLKTRYITKYISNYLITSIFTKVTKCGCEVCDCEWKITYKFTGAKPLWSLRSIVTFIIATIRLKRIGESTYLPGGKRYESAKARFDGLQKLNY